MNYKNTLYHKQDGVCIVEDVQDCTPIIEKNKKEFNSFDEMLGGQITCLETKLHQSL